MKLENFDKIEIECSCDSVDIWIGSRLYHFDNEDPTLGGKAIAVLLTDLGYKVELKEVA